MKISKIAIKISGIIFLGLLLNITLSGQSAHKNLRYGDENYYRKEYLKAEESYRKALQQDEKSVSGNHNLGNALYLQQRYDEAAKYFENAALQAGNSKDKAMSYHNLGNAYLSQLSGVGNPEQAQELVNKSITAYKQSLKQNPTDAATKYNLAFAQQLQNELQKEQSQPQPQEENQDKDTPPQDNKNPSGNEGDKEPPQDEPKPEPNQGENMTKDEAERLIKIMEEEERKVQEKMNQKNKQPNPSGKDW